MSVYRFNFCWFLLPGYSGYTGKNHKEYVQNRFLIAIWFIVALSKQIKLPYVLYHAHGTTPTVANYDNYFHLYYNNIKN